MSTDTRVDPNMALELAPIEAEAFDEITRLRAEQPARLLSRIIHRSEVKQIDIEISNVQTALERNLAETEQRVTKERAQIDKNRRQTDHLRFFFARPLAVEDRMTYLNRYDYDERRRLEDEYQPWLSFLSDVGVVFRGQPGVTRLTLFDSSEPKPQQHGVAVRTTIETLAARLGPGSEVSKQFADNLTTSDETGETTTHAIIKAAPVADTEETPNQGRSLTVTYTQQGEDVKVDVDVIVEEGAPEAEIVLGEHLEKILVYTVGSACGMHWPDIGFDGLGRDGLRSNLLAVDHYTALGGTLTPDQQEAYRAMQGRLDYQDREHWRLVSQLRHRY